jgi:hypothetical protein
MRQNDRQEVAVHSEQRNSIPSSLRLQGKTWRAAAGAARSAIDLFGDALDGVVAGKGGAFLATYEVGEAVARRSRFDRGFMLVAADEGHPEAIQYECGSVAINGDPNSDPQGPDLPRIPVAMPTSQD